MLETKIIFDNRNRYWNTDRKYNLLFIRHTEHYTNEMLAKNGWLSLNDIYGYFGLPKIIEAQVFGWRYSAGYDEQLACVRFDVHDGDGPDIEFDLQNIVRLI